jgi:hypothetical protein
LDLQRGIVSRDLARKGSRIWSRGSRGCEIAISRQLESSVGHSGVQVEYRWHKGFVSHREDSCGSRAVPRSRDYVDAWQSIRWDRVVDGWDIEFRISGTRG